MRGKICFLLLLAFLIPVLLRPPDDLNNTFDRFEYPEEKSNWATIYSKFLPVLFLSDIPAWSWENAGEIPARQLMIFYCAANQMFDNSGNAMKTVKAREMENFLSQYFDGINTERLRDTKYYSDQSQTYRLNFKLRDPVNIKLLPTESDSTDVTIQYEYYGTDKEIITTGEMHLRLDANNIKFVSCKTQSAYLDTLPEDGSVRFVYSVDGFEAPLWIEYPAEVVPPNATKKDMDILAQDGLRAVLSTERNDYVEQLDVQYTYTVIPPSNR